MGFEELFQLLIAFFILYGLFGGRKKKQPTPPESRPQRPSPPRRPARPRPEQRVERPAGAQPRRPPPQPVQQRREPSAPSPAPERTEAGFADEIYRILSGELEQRREDTLEARGAETAEGWNRFEEIRPVEEVTEIEAYSLETLEPAGGASHVAFHQKYVEPTRPLPEIRPYAIQPATARRLPGAGKMSLKDAVVWSEILGPPKGMP